MSGCKCNSNNMPLLKVEVILLVVVSVSGQTRPSCQYDKDQQFLDCSSRGFYEVPSDQFPVDARGIDLSFNKISQLENHAFWNPSSLEYLDLSNNSIQVFQPESFRGLVNLVCLNLSNNPFNFTPTVFTQRLFQPLVNLKVIRIQGFPISRNWMGIDDAFGQLKSLTTLLFDIPEQFIFGPGFAELKQLVTISTAGPIEGHGLCRLHALLKKSFQVFKSITLRELRLIKCPILFWDLDAFDSLTSLDVLDISYTMDVGIDIALGRLQSFQGRNMSEITLKMISSDPGSMSMVQVPTSRFVFLSNICVRLVDLSLNIIYLYEDSRKKIDLFNPHCLEHLNMSYHYTPDLLQRLRHTILTSTTLRSLDLSRGYSLPKSQGYVVPQQPFISKLLRLSVPQSLVWLSISINGYGCGKHFFVFSSPTNLRHLEVAYIGYNADNIQFTSGLEQLHYLDISGMISDNIVPDFFRNVWNLTSLRLTNTPQIGKTLQSSAELFSGLSVLEAIDLSSHELTDINSQVFQNNKQMRDLNLANNKLQRIPPTVADLPELQRLDMRSNFITHLSANEMILLDRWMNKAPDFKFLLEGNSLQCTCDTVLFIRWILRRKGNLDNPDNYTCFLSNGTRIAVSKFGEQLRDFEVKCVSHTYLIIAVVGSLALSVLILVFAAIYRYRLILRYWLYTKLQPPEDLFEDQEYVYDAFVAYTSDDKDWVVSELRPNIEPNDGPTRLCIHDRDFTFGKPIHMNIVEKMAESRKILLVISHGFLESTYGPLEIEYAGMKSLDQGRDDIILCVLMEEIPVRQMPRVLRNLWHKITFLKWSDHPQEQVIFWRNLKSAVCQDQV